MLAVLYDIHGNLPALEAVLEDARGAGADRFLLGGDYAAFGAWPAETVARLDALRDATWIRGNWDRWLATHPAEDLPAEPVIRAAAAAALEELDAATVQRLGALPPTAALGGACFCHASPASDMRGFSPEPDDTDEELAGDVAQPLLVFGHTHLQFARRRGGTLLCNPGSVGLPFDRDQRAAYALLPEGGEPELRRVSYDHAAVAAALRERGEAWADSTAGRIERAGP